MKITHVIWSKSRVDATYGSFDGDKAMKAHNLTEMSQRSLIPCGGWS